MNNDVKSLIKTILEDGKSYHTSEVEKIISQQYGSYTNGQFAAAWRDLLKKNEIIRINRGVYKIADNDLTYAVKKIISNAIKDIDKLTKNIDIFSLTPKSLDDINNIKLAIEKLVELQDSIINN
ncbi:hypothetical protein [Clostridium sp. HMP27]|uniref:hypothetical protein n=1 Tax=Clostridium sp. HMP27 TaxID=1487921 RepID=UPI00052C24EA|nr:hypothetical protein [Clostridium sp. HMP27]KGK86556.1 hypothetical protein DP68_13175 [Clostridium sp. HMP27]